MSNHADLLWFLLIVSISILGNGFVVVLIWTAKTSLGRVNEKLVEVTTKQITIESKLDAGLQRVHERVDHVRSDVDLLRGAYGVLRRIEDMKIFEKEKGE
jgi:hypothetical protein